MFVFLSIVRGFLFALFNAVLMAESPQAVQALLSQVMSELSGMRAALRPRALWVLVHHLNLHPEETSTWTALVTQLQAMADEAVLDRERSNRLAMASAQASPSCSTTE
jgi:hypothetical protein